MKKFIQHDSNILSSVKAIMYMLTISAAITLNGCWDIEYNDTIDLNNQTNDTIRTYVAIGVGYSSPTAYPDTILPSNLQEIGCEGMTDVLATLPPHVEGGIFAYHKRLPGKNDTISIFIINNDTLNRYGYEYVAEHNKISVRYDLSRKDLKRLDYHLSYPPSSAMADIHMSPSYEEVIKRTSMEQ